MRMSPERFEHLLSMVAPVIKKEGCRSRAPIPPAERLCICLRYLATGESQQSLSFSFRVGRATVSNIVKEVCAGIWESLRETFLKAPEEIQDWLRISREFENEWNFPHCLGAVDGKHVCMECPKGAGSAYFNYKKFHSLVLMAACDAKYCFTLLDIGGYGRDNDAAIFTESIFGKMFEESPTDLHIPSPQLTGAEMLPYVLIGDEIFALKPWFMKPFPGRDLNENKCIFNYRLSRARRTIENAFGILSAKWRIYRKPIRADVGTVEKIVKATVCLRNYLRLTENATYVPSGFVDCEKSDGEIVPGDWRGIIQNDEGGLVNARQLGGNRYGFEASTTRDSFMRYFISEEGKLDWQYQHVRSCGTVHK